MITEVNITRDKIERVLTQMEVRSTDYKWINFIFNIKEEELQGDPLGPRSDWSTYSECVDLYVQIREGRIHLRYVIWDGDMLNGERTHIRFTKRVSIPIEPTSSPFDGWPSMLWRRWRNGLGRSFGVSGWKSGSRSSEKSLDSVQARTGTGTKFFLA